VNINVMKAMKTLAATNRAHAKRSALAVRFCLAGTDDEFRNNYVRDVEKKTMTASNQSFHSVSEPKNRDSRNQAPYSIR
jgi:hypothetical protein